MTERCSKWSHAGRMSWQCERPVKAEGICAQHLAGANRRKANRAELDEQIQAERKVRAAADEACSRLAKDAVDARPEYDSISRTYTGRVSVDPAVLFSLLEALRRSV